MLLMIMFSVVKDLLVLYNDVATSNGGLKEVFSVQTWKHNLNNSTYQRQSFQKTKQQVLRESRLLRKRYQT